MSSAVSSAEVLPSPKEPSSDDSVPAKSSLLVHTASESQNTVPGFLKSSSSSFNEGGEIEVRDANSLPGAIGSTGAFDEHGASSLGIVAKPKAVSPAPEVQSSSMGPHKTRNYDAPSGTDTANSTASSSTLMKESKGSNTEATGKETSRRVNKLKKKRKRRRKSVSAPADAADAVEGGISAGKGRRKKKRRKRKTSKVSDSPSSSESVKEVTEPQTDITKATSTDGEQDILNKTAMGQKTLGTSIPVGKQFPRPMDRKMEELQVPAQTGLLDDEAVKGYYGKLVKAYLAPFSNGIDRSAFFNVMRRKTYSLSPPGSNKGIQTILFQLIKSSKFKSDLPKQGSNAEVLTSFRC